MLTMGYSMQLSEEYLHPPEDGTTFSPVRWMKFVSRRNTLPARKLVDMQEKQIGRRTLLKASGLVAASGALGSLWALVAGAGSSANARRRARWIKVVDRPTLGETTADYKRFSGKDIFTIYQPLKDQRDGAGSFEAEQASKAKRLAGWMSEKKPGYSLPDRQLSEGAFTVMHSAKPGSGLLAWTRTSVRAPEEMATAWKARSWLWLMVMTE